MSRARCAVTSRGSSRFSTRASISSLRLRAGRLSASAASIFFAYSCAATSSPRSMATILARLPGDLPSAPRAESPRVAATMAAGDTVAASTVAPRVFTIMVWPLMSAPGPCPVCMVVTPKRRTHSTSRSSGSYPSTARSSGCTGARALDLVLIVGLVQVPAEADHGVRVHEARDHDLRRQHAHPRWHRDLGGGADALDLAVADDHHAVLDRRPGHGVDGLAAHGDVAGGHGHGGGHQAEEKRAHQYPISRPSASIRSVSPWPSRPAPSPPTA